MTSWDPAQYERYSAERNRPAIDLISQIGGKPAEIWDLGCGSGSVTRMLAKKWPAAIVHGLDSSEEMLAQARRIHGIDWVLEDLTDWTPPSPIDLLFSNAALQWLGDHENLFPRLADAVAPGGTLAVQMPRNFGEPLHTLLAETARAPAWRHLAERLTRPIPVAEPAFYHRMLRSRFETLDIWETSYLQVLGGPDPVADWARGTAARPYLDALGEAAEDFMADYAARLRVAYPPLEDGTTLFPFNRLFVLAVKG
jgi:trans-aconitate 2-methyltransferase